MSSQGSRIWPFLAGVAVIAAGMGGASYRQRREMGVIPPAVVSDVDNRTLVASTQSLTGVSESEFFYLVLDLIKQQYVDPVKDEQKLALGAVRGMVNSLSDPNALYFSEEQFPAYEQAMNGEYQGIGVELELKYDPEQLKKFYATQAKLAEWNATGRKEVDGKLEELPDLAPGALIPDLVVSAVLPGSPAASAGLKSGDVIDGVDGKWSLSRREVEELNSAFDKIRQNKMDREAYLALRKRYMERSDNAITPTRLREKLTSGVTGSIKLYWRSPGVPGVRNATIAKSTTKIAPLSDGKLRFVTGADTALQEAVAQGQTKFDLRDSGFGNFETMHKALTKILPSGEYGAFSSERSKRPIPLTIQGSGNKETRLDLIVDASTTGAAKLFAEVLAAAGQAQLIGKLNSDPTMNFETFRLQGGAGYVIPTGIYQAREAQS